MNLKNKTNNDLIKEIQLLKSENKFLRQNSNNKLSHSLNYQLDFLDNLSDLVYFLDSDFRFVFWNKMCEILVGIPKKEILGKTLLEVFPKNENIIFLDKQYKSAYQSQERLIFDYQSVINGRNYYFEIYVLPYDDGLYIQAKDITSIRENILNKKRLELNYEQLIDRLSIGYIRDNFEGKVIMANQKFLEIFGFSKNDLNYLNLEDYVSPIDRERLRAYHENRISSKPAPEIYEYKGIRKSGEEIWLEVKVTSIIQNNQIIGTQSFITDITNRKNNELELIKFHKLLKTINLLNALFIAQNSVEEVFSESCRLLVEEGGFDMAWIGRVDEETKQVVAIADYGDKFDYLKKIKIYANNAPEGQGPVGIAIRDQNVVVVQDAFNDARLEPWMAQRKKTNWLSSIALPFKNDDLHNKVLVVYSTEENYFGQKEIEMLESVENNLSIYLSRKYSKKMLKENELKLRTIFENSKIGLSLTDADGKLETNSHYYDILGYSKEEFEGKNWQEITHPEDLPNDLKIFESFLNGSLDSHNWQKRYIHKKGNTIWVNISVSTIRDEYGNLTRMVTTINDITKEKLAENALIENQRLSAMGEIASSIAHDFNNSLQAMMGNLELIKFKDSLANDSKELLINIENIILSIADRVKALQRFGSPTNKMDNQESVNINDLIKSSIKQLQPVWKNSYEKAGFDLKIDEDLHDIPNLHINKGEFTTVIHNILKNSIEAMPVGGTICIHTHAEDSKIIIRFTDTGVGMSQESKMKLFNPFYTTKGFETGRGLGMSGAYTIIKELNGEIFVKHSELDEGTIIEINLPIVEKYDSIIQNRTEIISSEKKTNEHKILWVEDEYIIGENIRILLTQNGFNCELANSGKEALELLKNNEFNLMFTDIGMSGMSGLELVDKVRNELKSEIEIGISSGWKVSEEDIKKYRINYMLPKPFTLVELNKIIKKIS